MAKNGINKVIIVGRLGANPETRYMTSGDAVTNISIATGESWKDKTTGETKEKTEWHRIVFFKRLAEIVAQYAKKGTRMYVEGSLQTRKWQDQNGQDRYSTEIVASEMQLLDAREAGGAPSGNGGGFAPNANAQQPQQNAYTQNAQPQSAPQQKNDFAMTDDDVPF
jgi:single-strand DNA-binding protein